MNFKIVVTSNTDVQKISREFQLCENASDLDLFLEVEVGKEKQVFASISNHLSKLQCLAGLSVTFKKYSVFDHFQIITKVLSQLSNLQKLSFYIKQDSFFSDNNTKELTNAIICLPQLCELSIVIAIGTSINAPSFIYFNECIRSLLNLSKLDLQLKNYGLYNNGDLVNLGQTLRSCKKLEQLNLYVDFQCVNQESISLFCEAISSLSLLLKFEFSFNQLNDIPFIFSELMKSISTLKRLEYLKLDPSFLHQKEFLLTTKSFDSIKLYLDQLKNLKVFKLNGQIGIISFLGMKSLSALSQLKVLKLQVKINQKPSLSQQEQNSEDQLVNENLFSQFKLLEKLNLSFESDFNEENYRRSYSFMMQEDRSSLDYPIFLTRDNPQTIYKLRVTSPEDLQQFTENLAKGFNSMVNLSRLKIKWHRLKISESEQRFFFRQIKELQNLRTFRLITDNSFNVDQHSAQILGTSLSHLKLLEVISIELNASRDFDQSIFFDQLQSLSKLESLSISFKMNTINQKQSIELDRFSSLKKLRIINLHFDKQFENGKIFFSSLSRLINLTDLCLQLKYTLTKPQTELFGKSLLKLEQLESVELRMEECSFSQIDQITNGLQSKSLHSLSIQIWMLQYEEIKKNERLFDCLKTLRKLCFEVEHLEKNTQRGHYSLILNSLNKLKDLEKLRLQLQDFYDGDQVAFIDFLYSSPQLLNVSLDINNSISENQEKETVKKVKPQNEVSHHLRKAEFLGQSAIISLSFMSFVQSLKNLKKIKIEEEIRNNTDKEFSIFRNENKNQYLGDLFIRINNENDVNKIQFLKQLSLFKNLKSLDYRIYDKTSQMSKQEIYEFGNSLFTLENLQTLNLELVFSNVTDKRALNQLTTGFRSLKNLTSLTITPINDIFMTYDHLQFIMNSFCHLINLKQLTIDAQSYQYDERDNWLETFGTSLPKLENLQFLNLIMRNFYYKTRNIEAGIEAIGNSFKYLNQLYHLNITLSGFYKIGKNGASSLGKGISNLLSLNSLVLDIGQDGNLSQQSAMQIAQGLVNLPNLKRIQFTKIGQTNKIKPELMNFLTKNLSSRKGLSYIKIDLFVDGCLKNPPFEIESLLLSHPEQLQTELEFKVEHHVFSCNLICNFHDCQIDLNYSYILKSYQSSNILLPASVLKNLKRNCNIRIRIRQPQRIESQSVMNLFESFDSLSITKLELELINNNKEDCLKIVEAVSTIYEVRELHINLQSNQLTCKDFNTAVNHFASKKSKDLQVFFIKFNEYPYKEEKELDFLAQQFFKFQELKELHLNLDNLSSIEIKQNIHKSISQNLLRLITLYI